MFRYIGRVASMYDPLPNLFLLNTYAECLLCILVTPPSLHSLLVISYAYLQILALSTANLDDFDEVLFHETDYFGFVETVFQIYNF